MQALPCVTVFMLLFLEGDVVQTHMLSLVPAGNVGEPKVRLECCTLGLSHAHQSSTSVSGSTRCAAPGKPELKRQPEKLALSKTVLSERTQVSLY